MEELATFSRPILFNSAIVSLLSFGYYFLVELQNYKSFFFSSASNQLSENPPIVGTGCLLSTS
ncbi:MAG: hypothetical protein H7A25_04800 [Leptospiraceae bacterium]|nr:hypothetical protein [Leptospiraceae bacterium]